MVLEYMHMHIDMVGFKRHKLSKYGLNHFMFVVLPKISP